MKRIIDYSFLRLKPTIAEALDLSDNPFADIFNYSFIQLSPSGRYLQISNSSVDISFGGDYKAEITTTCGEVLKDVTDSVYIYEGTSAITGIRNIAFEIIALNYSSFGRDVLLKLSSPTINDDVFYTNPFRISTNSANTIKLSYRDFGQKYGFDYDSFDFLQQIQLKCIFTKPTNETEKSSYLQSTGNKLNLENTISVVSNYDIEFLYNHAQKALIRALEHSVLFINNERCTFASFTTDEVLGTTNNYKGKLTANIDETEYNVEVNQISPAFTLSNYAPKNIIAFGTAVNSLSGTFSKNISLGSGTVRLIDSNSLSVLQTYTQDDISTSGASFTITDSGLVSALGEYKVVISSGLFISLNGETDSFEWSFEIRNPDFSSADFSPTDFLTN